MVLRLNIQLGMGLLRFTGASQTVCCCLVVGFHAAAWLGKDMPDKLLGQFVDLTKALKEVTPRSKTTDNFVETDKIAGPGAKASYYQPGCQPQHRYNLSCPNCHPHPLNHYHWGFALLGRASPSFFTPPCPAPGSCGPVWTAPYRAAPGWAHQATATTPESCLRSPVPPAPHGANSQSARSPTSPAASTASAVGSSGSPGCVTSHGAWRFGENMVETRNRKKKSRMVYYGLLP